MDFMFSPYTLNLLNEPGAVPGAGRTAGAGATGILIVTPGWAISQMSDIGASESRTISEATGSSVFWAKDAGVEADILLTVNVTAFCLGRHQGATPDANIIKVARAATASSRRKNSNNGDQDRRFDQGKSHTSNDSSSPGAEAAPFWPSCRMAAGRSNVHGSSAAKLFVCIREYPGI